MYSKIDLLQRSGFVASDRLAPAVGPSVLSQIVQEGWKDVTSGRYPVLDRAARVFGDRLEDPPKHNPVSCPQP